MTHLADRLETLPGYPLADLPGIKRRMIEQGRDVIDLGAGDNDRPPPAEAVAAMKLAVDDPAMSKYGYQQGLPAFRTACVAYLRRRFAVDFDPHTETLPLIGSKEALAHLPLTVVNPGDVVILPEPGYQAYLGGAVFSGAEPHVIPLEAGTDFLLDLASVPTQVLERTRLVYLNYPNNPTAATAPTEYLEEIVALCRRHDILLAYDNAYCDITFDGYQAPSIFQIDGARDIAVEFFSLSKSFSMTGWRLGFAVGRPELIGALTRVKTYLDTGPFLAVQAAGAAALDRAEVLVSPIKDELQRRRDAAVEALTQIGLPLEPPRATMYLWIPLPDGMASRPFARRALEEAGVLVLPGAAFGPAGEGYFRIALIVGADRLREAVMRLGPLLDESASVPVEATR